MAQEDCLKVLREKPLVWISTLEIHREVMKRGKDLGISTIRVNMRGLAKICDNVEMRIKQQHMGGPEHQYRWVPDNA